MWIKTRSGGSRRVDKKLVTEKAPIVKEEKKVLKDAPVIKEEKKEPSVINKEDTLPEKKEAPQIVIPKTTTYKIVENREEEEEI